MLAAADFVELKRFHVREIRRAFEGQFKAAGGNSDKFAAEWEVCERQLAAKIRELSPINTSRGRENIATTIIFISPSLDQSIYIEGVSFFEEEPPYRHEVKAYLAAAETYLAIVKEAKSFFAVNTLEADKDHPPLRPVHIPMLSPL